MQKAITRVCTIGLIMMALAAPATSQQRIVGYYASWHSGILPASAVQYSHLTHILVAFSFPNSDGSLTNDPGIPFATLVQAAHAQGVKVLISLGGAGSSSNFPAATSDSTMRSTLISNIASFLQVNEYDGVDLDWETPANTAETAQLTALVKELRAQFDLFHPAWLITMAVPPTNWGGQHFDFAGLLGSVDWFNVMCYDFYGSWSGYAGHDSPLCQPAADPTQAGSDSTSVVYLKSRGVPAPKIVLGIPFYAVQFSAHGLYQPTTVSMTLNPYYPDVLQFLATGWTYHWDPAAMSPYLLNGDSTQFVTFEDANSVRLKGEFALRQGLGGLMCWELAQDVMPGGGQPLLETMAHTMGLTTGVREGPAEPASFVLRGNFPNPFNPATTVQFELSERSEVTLEILSVLGQRIAVIRYGNLEAGSHQKVVDLSAQSSGVYFYRLLIAGNGLSTTSPVGKMVLLK